MDIYVDTSIKADKKKKTLDELFSEHAGLEYELNKSVHLADVKDGENISINRISDIIDSVSGRGAYIDFALIDDINFENVETRGKKYVAFLLLNDSIHLINIGSAEKVDSMIRSYRELAGVKSESAINLSKTDHFGRELYDLVYKPIHLLLNDVDHIFISPDGMLNMLPFEALKDETNKYLLDKALVSYVSAGRDIMRFGVLESKSEKAVLFYNPDFEALDISHAAEYRSAKNFDFGSIRFSPLPQTAAEAKYILDVLEEGEIPVETFSGADASESNLYSLNKPKILHIATHGFFVDGDGSPMYRSGFALAGASESVKKGISDGLMSADKITGANLHGTDLVVLSACDTGAGEVMNGEGVFGLKRAFMLSGAKSVVFSNWKVSDRVTAEFMGKFYEYMLSEKYNRAEALRRAQLDIKDRYRSPFYWASFSLTGDPGFRKQD
jgi:CHAT domain-containing protein